MISKLLTKATANFKQAQRSLLKNTSAKASKTLLKSFQATARDRLVYRFSGSDEYTPDRQAFTSINPYNQQPLHKIPYTSRMNLTKQIKDLHQARLNHTADTCQEFERLASLLSSKKSELAQLITLETGKCISQSLLEVEKCIGHLVEWGGKSSSKKPKMSQGLLGKYHGLKRVGLGKSAAKDEETGYFVDPLGKKHPSKPHKS